MKIRRYVGSNTQEAMLKVKMDMGNDAVILNTRKVRQKGILKYFSKPLVEILAAIDDDYGTRKTRLERNGVKQVEQSRQGDYNGSGMQLQAGMRQAVAINNEGVVNENTVVIKEIEKKVNLLEGMFNKIYDYVQSSGRMANGKHDEAVQGSRSEIIRDGFLPNIRLAVEQDLNAQQQKLLDMLYHNLISNETEINIAKQIVKIVKERYGNGSVNNDIMNLTQQVIKDIIGKPQPIALENIGKKPRVVMFVGPTGVGKTTTIAKIAADLSLNQNVSVALITADTYRIAAVDQLKTYAEILCLPIEVAYSPSDVENSISRFRDKDLILIDTAGRNYKKLQQLEEIKNVLDVSNADEIYLVMSASASWKTCRDIIKSYHLLEKYKIIFTKLDEAPAMGVILNTKVIANRDLSYVTTGQSVPDDIDVLNLDKLARNLLKSNNEIS